MKYVRNQFTTENNTLAIYARDPLTGVRKSFRSPINKEMFEMKILESHDVNKFQIHPFCFDRCHSGPAGSLDMQSGKPLPVLRTRTL